MLEQLGFLSLKEALGSIGQDNDRESSVVSSDRQRIGHGCHQPSHCARPQSVRHHPVLLHSPGSIDRLSLFAFPARVKELPQSGLFAYAHVEDVAEAHISAQETTEASGRYICYERVISEEKLVKLIRKLYPNSSFPRDFPRMGFRMFGQMRK